MKIPIIYGSQTGNAAYLAELVRRSFLYGYDEFSIYKESQNIIKEIFFVCEADSVEIKQLLTCKYIIIVCSTHGDGDGAFNIKNLWNFLKYKELPDKLMTNTKFAIYGLGDSSYEKFNFFAKKMRNRLINLGAEQILACVDGDSQDKQGYMTTFKPFLKKLHEYFSNVKIENDIDAPLCYLKKPLYYATVTNVKYSCIKSEKYAILSLEIAIEGYEEFTPGDCIGIRPENYNYLEFIDHNRDTLFLNIGCSQMITGDKSFDNCNEVRIIELIKTYYDINCLPPQIIFLQLHNEIIRDKALSLNTVLDKNLLIEKLLEIYKDYDVYYEYILLPKRTFFEVLQEFKITVTFLFLIKYIPRICIRYFTAAKVKDKFQININLVNYKTQMSKARKGLCSEYVKMLRLQSTFKVVVVKGTLDFSSDNLLFICTGTGITLPYSVLHHYSNKNILIFYGFRNKNIDQLYADEISNIKGNNIKLISATSREGQKSYVQDVFRSFKIDDIDKYRITISGNTRLTKIFRRLFLELYESKKIYFQSETW